MRLCHIVPSLEEKHGGPSKSVKALSVALAEEGNHVDLLATDGTGAQPTVVAGQLKTQIFARDWPQRICPSAGLRRTMASLETDVVHHHSLWLRTTHYARQLAQRRSVPFVISPRGMMSKWAWKHRRWRKRISDWLIHPGAIQAVQGWHATSVEEEAEIRALGFTQPICVAPNGVEAPEPAEIATAREHWLKLCPATATKKVALFYSRFHQKKRVIELIDQWLEHAPADWLLLLVGIPQDYTPATLEKYALKMSGGGRVRAFDGRGQPPPYAVASLFLLPSHNENFGLVIAEAMAHGVPTVVTDTTPWSGVNREQIGWCVPWSDYSEALAAATAESPERLRDRGERARTWVLREYSWNQSARRLMNFYAQLGARPA